MKGRLEVGKGSNLGRNKGKSKIRSPPWISLVREEKGREARERQQTVTHLGRWAWSALRCSAWEAGRRGWGAASGACWCVLLPDGEESLSNAGHSTSKSGAEKQDTRFREVGKVCNSPW